MKQKYILLVILFSFAFLSDEYVTDMSTTHLLKKVIEKYQSNLSCSLSINNQNLKIGLNIDMAWINDSTTFRKTRLHFAEGLDYPAIAWLWSMKEGKDKKWMTKPNGKKVDVTDRKELDFPVILPDESILEGYHVVSDTLNYNNYKCAVVEMFKISRGKKKGPFSKLWIDIDSELIYKIEEIDYRKETVIKETVMEYFDSNDSIYKELKSFPKIIHINDFRNNQSSSIELSNYKINQKFDLIIFEPVDIK